MITTWKIFNTERQTPDGVIIEVTYGCTVELDSCTDRTLRKLQLVGDASLEGFVPYKNLTEETILEWVKNSLGAEAVSNIETSLQNNVTVQKAAKDAKTTKKGLPWEKLIFINKKPLWKSQQSYKKQNYKN